MVSYLTEKSEGIFLKIFVQPRSSKNEIVGPHADALKIKITAPPVEGAANKMCTAFLAKCLKLPKSSIEIVSGSAARSKSVMIMLPDNEPNRRERRRIVRFFSSFAS
jgi:uncharacterized protein (TIGR00251 family)